MIKLGQLLQSLLLALIVVGIFAAMARNAYGFDLIGSACMGIAVLFLFQVVWKVIGEHGILNRSDIQEMAELVLLAFLLLLFGLRAFYIYIDFGEIMLYSVPVLLLVVYTFIGYDRVTLTKKENASLGQNLIFFYSSTGLFLLSLSTRFNALWSMILGVAAVMVAMPFFISILRRQQFEIKGKSTTSFQFVVASKNKAGLLFIFFISSALYTGLSQFDLIPEIENSTRPKNYIELINQAETGEEKKTDGKYHHEKYKEAMNKFLERHGNK